MKKVLFLTINLCIIVIGLSACSSTSTPANPKAEQAQAQETPPATKPKTVFDTKRPTSYEEYKRWRRENDPSGEAYSDYKKWEISYRRWQSQQKK